MVACDKEDEKCSSKLLGRMGSWKLSKRNILRSIWTDTGAKSPSPWVNIPSDEAYEKRGGVFCSRYRRRLKWKQGLITIAGTKYQYKYRNPRCLSIASAIVIPSSSAACSIRSRLDAFRDNSFSAWSIRLFSRTNIVRITCQVLVVYITNLKEMISPKAKPIATSKLHIPIIIDGRYWGLHLTSQTKELTLHNMSNMNIFSPSFQLTGCLDSQSHWRCQC